jgi:hypothetical protein
MLRRLERHVLQLSRELHDEEEFALEATANVSRDLTQDKSDGEESKRF